MVTLGHLVEESRQQTVADAFESTARTLEQFKVERVRVEGLSCMKDDNEGNDEPRVLTEQAFMREFVFQSRPCVIVGALESWPAMRRWRDDTYLFDLDGQRGKEKKNKKNDEKCESAALSSSEAVSSTADEDAAEKREEVEDNDGLTRVTVALTPNGRADAVTYVTYRDAQGKKGSSDNDNDNDDTDEKNKSNSMVEQKPGDIKTQEEVGEERSALVTKKLFMCAAEVRVTLPELYRLLRSNPPHPPRRSLFVDMTRPTAVVAYAQMQNNCLELEYGHLQRDVPRNLDDFGARVFGGPHEAANVWFGTPASVSSMHQDWVENLYAVVRGVKEFVLVPPWEGVFVPKPELPSAAFAVEKREEKEEGGCGYVFKDAPVLDNEAVPWMDVELTPAVVEVPSLMPESLRDRLHPLVVYVKAGEVLYLPAMWLHRVAQHADEEDTLAGKMRTELSTASSLERRTTEQQPTLPLIAAVNYWYDMNFTNPAVVMLREFGLLL